jgi:signal transduction histidine kinase
LNEKPSAPQNGTIEDVLWAWRSRALDIILKVLAVAALPAVVIPLVAEYHYSGTLHPRALVYITAYALVLVLAFVRRLDVRIRGCGLLAVGYYVAVTSLARGGMVASGRLYLLFLPVIALVLLGTWGGGITTLLSGVIYVVFMILAHRGVLDRWMVIWNNPVNLAYWIEAGTALLMILASSMVLLWRFYRLQVKTLITERKTSMELAEANVRLEHYSATLEQRVAERTAALSQANAELRQYNAELDAFAHTVAHDLKTPLAIIVGFSSLLEARLDSMSQDQVLENLHRISRTGAKMSNIIDELLLLASVRKMEAVETEPLAMHDVVAGALDRLEAQIIEREAEIILPEAWPQACGYAPWVEEVWTNYLSNAIKYGGTPPRVELGFWIFDSHPSETGAIQTTHQHPAVTLKSEIQHPKSKTAFWVRDNGPGLTPEEQATLFTEFTRLQQTRVEGHGLGLSIVRRIVEKLGGEVGVESTVGEGSCFWFTLPRKEA